MRYGILAIVSVVIAVAFVVFAVYEENTVYSHPPIQANQGPEQYLPYRTTQTCQIINNTLPDSKCTPGV